jgi:hypothetical protein
VLRYTLPAVAVLCGTLAVFANSLDLPRVSSAPRPDTQSSLRYRLYDVVMVPPAQRASAPAVAATTPTQALPLAPVDVSAPDPGEQSGYMLEPTEPREAREHRGAERAQRVPVHRQVGRAFRDLLTRIQQSLDQVRVAVSNQIR